MISLCTALGGCMLPDGTDAFGGNNPQADGKTIGGNGGNSCFTPGQVSKNHSVISVSSSSVLVAGTTVITLQTRDCNNSPLLTGGSAVTFFLGIGSSGGTIGAVTDNLDGTYTSTFTATTMGIATEVRGTIDTKNITTAYPAIKVNLGSYYRNITLSPVTDQADLQVKVTLNSGNFTYANANSNGDDLRFIDSSGTLQDYWIERWDVAGNSIVWVQVAASGTSSLSLYYGNPNLTAGSSDDATFSYASANALYWQVSNAAGAGGVSTNVASYTANNNVTVETNSGSSTLAIGENLFQNWTNLVQGAVTANGPISTRGLNYNQGLDTVMPSVWRGTTFGYPDSRATSDRWVVYNPSAVDADVTIDSYDSSGVYQSTSSINTVAAGAFSQITYGVSYAGIVNSTQPVLVFYSNNGVSDATALAPPSTEIYGISSNNGFITLTEDGTTGTIYLSNGSTIPFSGNKGKTYTTGSGAAQGAGAAVRVVADKPVIGGAQADSDGSETMSFWGREELNADYILSFPSQYISIACPYTTQLTVYNPDFSVNSTATCDPAGNTVGKSFFGNTGSTIDFQSGTRVVGDNVFFMYAEYDIQDETNVLGPKQARLYTANPPAASLSAEQTP